MSLLLEYFEFLRRKLFNAARRRTLHLNPRRWSNSELRRWGPVLRGAVVNISAWRDEDKEGRHYRDYFPHATEYVLTNYWGSAAEHDGHPNSLFLDLEGEVPENLRAHFDVALAHTVLEHVFDVRKALRNIAALTRDVMILVVPFMQDEHYTASLYGDYWRFTPLGLKRALEEEGFELVYLSSNESPWYPIYLFVIASKSPAQWRNVFPSPKWAADLGRSIYVYENAVW